MLAFHRNKSGLELNPDGRWRFAVQVVPLNDIPFHGSLDTIPHLEFRAAMLSMRVQCPITDVLSAMVPGLGAVLSLLDITQISALITEGAAQGTLDGLPPKVKTIFLGTLETKMDEPGPLSLGVDMPVLRFDDQAFQVKPAIQNGLVQVHLESVPVKP